MLKIEGGGEWLSAPATLPEVGIKPVEEKKKKRSKHVRRAQSNKKLALETRVIMHTVERRFNSIKNIKIFELV